MLFRFIVVIFLNIKFPCLQVPYTPPHRYSPRENLKTNHPVYTRVITVHTLTHTTYIYNIYTYTYKYIQYYNIHILMDTTDDVKTTQGRQRLIMRLWRIPSRFL